MSPRSINTEVIIVYFKSARGHARFYMQSIQTREDYEKMTESPHMDRVLRSFMDSARSKKPGRVLKRLALLMDKKWMGVDVRKWSKDDKIIQCRRISYDRSAIIEIQEDYDKVVFQDDLLQLNDLFMRSTRTGISTHTGAGVSITLHAITRLLEREGLSPVDLAVCIPNIMAMVHHIGMAAFDTGYPAATNSYLIPFVDGALVAINVPIKTSVGTCPMRVDGLSIRTYLAPDMITPEMRKRMYPVSRIIDETYFGDGCYNQAQTRDLLEQNCRPYTPKPAKGAVPTPAPARRSMPFTQSATHQRKLLEMEMDWA